MADKKIGNSIFRFEQEAGIDSKLGNWGGRKFFGEGEDGNGEDDGGGISFSCEWFSDKERKNKITEAVIGDLVFYRIICNGIPENTRLKFLMYDTDQPLGNTNLNKVQEGIVKNKKVESSVFFGVDYVDYIEDDSGDEIEIYWKVRYNNKEYDIFNSNKNLNLGDDEYYRAIVGEPKKKKEPRYVYTCNCGWVDTSHAFEKTKRKRIDIGADNLWKQIKNESGVKSQWKNGFQVIYSQDIVKLGLSIGVTKEYFVKYGLSLKTKEQIALSIFQEVSLEFEQLQSLHPTSGSSFEPADLVSNILGFYSVIRPKLTKNYILDNLCKQLGTDKSAKIYKKYPGTFTISKYKNKKFTPRFFDNEYCKNPVFPKEFQEIKPYPKDNDTFRDWIDLFDIHKGIPPIKGPK